MTRSSIILSLIGVLALATIHLFAGHVHQRVATRPTWLTALSGMSVAYVFVHLLPELAASQARWLELRPSHGLRWLDSQIYLAALIGLILALGLDRVPSRRQPHFWLQIVSLVIYNAMIGGFALLVTGIAPLFLALIAVGAHFVVVDHGVYMQHPRAYQRVGRWLLAASTVSGWLVAALWDEPVIVEAVVLGLVSGGIILNAIKGALPGEIGGRFAPWVAGAVSYAMLLLALKYSER